MTETPTHPPCAAQVIAAVIGAMLCVLLAALFGLAGARRRALERPGVMTVVLQAEADAEMIFEPYVEWVAVPAPWRNGKLLRPWHAIVPPHRVPPHRARPGALLHGPPLGALHC